MANGPYPLELINLFGIIEGRDDQDVSSVCRPYSVQSVDNQFLGNELDASEAVQFFSSNKQARTPVFESIFTVKKGSGDVGLNCTPDHREASLNLSFNDLGAPGLG